MGKIYVGETGRRYTEEEFLRFVERRVERVLKGVHGPLAVAVSGGKDSSVMAYILSQKYEIYPFYIDLGIEGFDLKPVVKELGKKMGGDVEIIDLKREYGFTVPEAAERLRRAPCSICGVVKRYVMNAYAWERGVPLATGHTMDDFVTMAWNNLAGEVKYLRYVRPQLPGDPRVKLAPRIRPLFYVRDEWNRIYADIAGVPYSSEVCPLKSVGFSTTAWIKENLGKIEERIPGSFIRVLKNVRKISVPGEEEPRACKICGHATSREICSFCRIRIALGIINPPDQD